VGDLLIEEAEAGASQQLWLNLAQLFGAVRDPERAAKCAEAIDDNEMAAGFYEASYDWLRAAETYKKAGIPLKAAAMYERGQYFEKAAAIYLDKKDILRAANCYAKCDAYYHAGHLYMKVPRFEQAVAMLQKVERKSKYYAEASVLLARFFESRKNAEAAIGRYREATQGRPVNEKTLDLHIRLAGLLTAEGRLDEAEKSYQAVLTVDAVHRGALEGLKRLHDLRDDEVKLPSDPPLALPTRTPVSATRPELAAEDAADRWEALPPISLPEPAPAPEPEPALPKAQPKKPQRLIDRPPSVVVMREDFDVFRALPIFAKLSLEELRIMHTLAERVEFSPGKIIIEAGASGDALFVIAEGAIRVELISDKKVLEVATLGQGATVGEMSFLDEAPGSARVTAMTPVTAYRFPNKRLRAHLDADPNTGFKVIRVLGRILSIRLREANLSMLR
jgi:tetratricopeptide (TPR) repeat protein